MSRLTEYIHTPGKLILPLGYRGWFRFLSDRAYLKLAFRCLMGYKLNLDDPQTFNEKLQWLKLNDRRPEYTVMVDKYAVRQYVADVIGEEYLVPLLGVWDSVEDIDFNALPEQFVLKCNHDSGGLVICRDKKCLDVAAAKKKLSKRLKRNYYELAREWPYKDVKPRIVAEQYLENSKDGLHDYKIWCFGGKPTYVQYILGRISSVTYDAFYDFGWKNQNIAFINQPMQYEADKPECLESLYKIAATLSSGMPFARIDLYVLEDGSIKFGEITPYPAAGFHEFQPKEIKMEFGNRINLSDVNTASRALQD